MKLTNQIFEVFQVKGRGRGKKIGLPTFNFSIPKNLHLAYGVYAGWLYKNNKKFQAAIHFGPRPQFAESDPSLEAFILDELPKNNVVPLKLEFVEFIRIIKKFPTINDMLTQIDQDILQIKEILKLDL